jgi:hypothetical protein
MDRISPMSTCSEPTPEPLPDLTILLSPDKPEFPRNYQPFNNLLLK